MPPTPQERRLLNRWNAARQGWDRFHDGSSRAAERLARKPLDLTGQPDTSQEKP